MTSKTSSDASPAPGKTLVGVILVVSVFCGIYFLMPGILGALSRSESEVENENAKLKAQLTELQAKQDELDAEQLMEIEEQQLSLSHLVDLDTQGKLAQKEVAAFRTQAELWKDRTEALASDDTGRRIAGETDFLQAYHSLVNRSLPQLELADAAEAKLSGLLMPVREALKNENPLFVPSKTTASAIGLVAEESNVAAKAYQNANRVLDALLEDAADSPQMSPETLEQALESIERSWATNANQQAVAAAARVRKEEAQKLMQLKVENERKLAAAAEEVEKARAKSELEKLEAEKAASKAEAEMKIAKLEAETQRKQLLQDFEREQADIKKYLAPFLQSAYSQPGRYQAMKRTSEKKPMSLKALQATGALEDSLAGLRALHLSATKLTDRQSGVFSEQYNEYATYLEQYIPTAKRAQALLLKYGDLLVEKQMLSP